MPEITAENRIPVPVIDSQLKTYTAGSGVGLATTGGTRCTMLFKPSMGRRMIERSSRNAFTCGKPQIKTRTLRTIQGSHARRTCVTGCRGRGGGPTLLTAAAPTLAAATVSRSKDVQTVSGCHSFRKSARHPIDISEATTSTSQGPWKFEIRNCGIAKLAPATRTAGQIWKAPRQPANATMSQNGTMTEKTGS